MASVLKVWFNAMVPALNKATGRPESVHCCKVEFALGIGPCGKNVDRLDVTKITGAVSIMQYCSDGEVKEFLYMDDSIVGRVNVLHREGRP